MKKIPLLITCVGLLCSQPMLRAQCVNSPSGLTHWWAAEGNPGDFAGTAKGTATGITYVTGKVGQAFSFSGSAPSISFTEVGNFGTNDFTVDYWMKTTATRLEGFWSKRPACNMNTGGSWFDLRNNTTGMPELYISGASLQYCTNLSTTVAVNDGNWHHLAWVREGTTLRVYVDGQLDNSVVAPGIANINNSTGMKLGTSSCVSVDGTSRYSGAMDEFSMFDRALTATEIQSIYNAATDGKCPVVPSINTQPANKVIAIGGSATYTVTAYGASALSYQWRLNGDNIANATNSSYAVTVPSNSEHVYPIHNYTVVVSNNEGTVTSDNALLEVKPTIITDPVGAITYAGDSVTMTAFAAASSPFTYQWRRNGANISGATGTSYTIVNGQQSASGTYTVRVSNSDGSDISAGAVVGFDAVPTIVSQPASVAVPLGNAAAFSVTAGGVGPFTYQWKFNGVNISGKTTTFLSIGVGTTNAVGDYSVVVSSIYGTVTSDNAALTINESPVCTDELLGVLNWWPAEGDANDFGGGLNHGTVVGTVTYPSAQVGQGFSFDGSSGQVTFGTAGNFGTNDFTIQGWMKKTATRSESFLEKRPSCNMDFGPSWWSIRGSSTLHFEIAGPNNAGFKSLATTVPLNNGLWHHVAWTREGVTLKVYVDGLLNNSTTTSSIIDINNTGSLSLGKSSCAGVDGTYYYSGLMDELEIFSRALTASEIDSIYTAASASYCP